MLLFYGVKLIRSYTLVCLDMHDDSRQVKLFYVEISSLFHKNILIKFNLYPGSKVLSTTDSSSLHQAVVVEHPGTSEVIQAKSPKELRLDFNPSAPSPGTQAQLNKLL